MEQQPQIIKQFSQSQWRATSYSDRDDLLFATVLTCVVETDQRVIVYQNPGDSAVPFDSDLSHLQSGTVSLARFLVTPVNMQISIIRELAQRYLALSLSEDACSLSVEGLYGADRVGEPVRPLSWQFWVDGMAGEFEAELTVFGQDSGAALRTGRAILRGILTKSEEARTARRQAHREGYLAGCQHVLLNQPVSPDAGESLLDRCRLWTEYEGDDSAPPKLSFQLHP